MEKIKIVVEEYELEEIVKELKKNPGIEIEIKSNYSISGFSLSSDAISIIFVSGITILPVIISSIIHFLQRKKSGTIIIVGATGRKIVIPRDTPPEEIERYIRMAKEIDIDHISIIKSA